MGEFYRHREPQLKPTTLNLNSMVQQVVELTKAKWSDIPQQQGFVINIQTDLADELPGISGVENEIREALTNLVFNAVDAMPEGGTLILKTQLADGPPTSSNASMQKRVQLEVTDTGNGMDEETKRRCLEPFYTTKGERGTGLGLAMVYGIAQRHGADIEIESEVGRGTTFRLIFLVPGATTSPGIQSETPPPVASRLRILVVDDDPLLLKSLCDILEADGHAVTVANGGEAGINAFRSAHEHRRPFGVVITDLGMPHVDGRKVAQIIKEESPLTSVILLTGWGQRLAAEGNIPAGVDQVLSKPPKLAELREALARRGQSAKA
jgi:CheY-like chemotaxis protein